MHENVVRRTLSESDILTKTPDPVKTLFRTLSSSNALGTNVGGLLKLPEVLLHVLEQNRTIAQ